VAGWPIRPELQGEHAPARGGRLPANLALVNLDLKCCLFQGARNWAGLRIEGARPFADTPDDKVRLFQWLRLWRRWTHRQVLAEEQKWRKQCFRGTWNAPECQSLDWLSNVTGQPVELLLPYQLELIYRALRKAQEDGKNEPGAADFYYGETEMRRHATSRWSVERAVLTAYWLVSGYALRLAGFRHPWRPDRVGRGSVRHGRVQTA
jgi:hypothetical protein